MISNPRDFVYITAEVLVGAASIIGNSMVLAAIMRTRQLHTVTYVFVGNLAIADIVVGILVPPLSAMSFDGLPHDFYGCLFVNSLILIFTNVSILMLLAIALERFLAIKEPYIYHRVMTVRRAVVFNMCVWLVGTLLGLVPMFGWHAGERNFQFCRFTAVITYPFLVYFQFFGVILSPLFLIVCIYTYIYVIVRRHTRLLNALHSQVVANHNPSSGGDGERDTRENRKFNNDVRAAKMFALIIFLFALCWCPLYILNCVYLFCGLTCGPTIEVLLATIVLSHAHSLVNPLVFISTNKRIRRAIRPLLGMKTSDDDSLTDTYRSDTIVYGRDRNSEMNPSLYTDSEVHPSLYSDSEVTPSPYRRAEQTPSIHTDAEIDKTVRDMEALPSPDRDVEVYSSLVRDTEVNPSLDIGTEV